MKNKEKMMYASPFVMLALLMALAVWGAMQGEKKVKENKGHPLTPDVRNAGSFHLSPQDLREARLFNLAGDQQVISKASVWAAEQKLNLRPANTQELYFWATQHEDLVWSFGVVFTDAPDGQYGDAKFVGKYPHLSVAASTSQSTETITSNWFLCVVEKP